MLRDSAKGGASKAAAQAPRPRPNVGKMAGAIRGLSALGGGGGGTGASLKLDPLSASGVPNRAAGSNALTRSQATPGFRGATSRSGASSGAGEDLRAAGARQSDIFNKGGGAAAALDSASREAIPAGGAGSSGGRPGEGGETKNPGGNSQKDNKSLGESLAFIRQKMEMEKALDLKWERKKWNEFGRQKMMEESALKLGFDMFGKFAEKAFINPLADAVGQAVAGGGGSQVGWECTMTGGGVSKFSKGEVAARGWEVRPNGDLISKGGQGAGAGAPLGKCKEAVVGSSNAGGDGTTTDRRDGSGVKAPGADQMAGRERRMSDASGKLGNERDDALALTEQIKGTCEGLTDPKLAAVKANCLEFQRESGELAKGLGGLTTASEEMTKAWRFLGTASGNMEREQTNLNASVRSLGTAAQKLTAAEQALRVPAGTEELPKDLATKAQTEVEAARAALKAAKTSHEASKPGVDKTNQALIDSKARGGAADDALKTANTDITGVAVPKAVDAAGTTIQLAPFETKLAASKQRALDAWLEIRKDHTAWSKGQGFGEQSKEALHGTTAAAEEMKIDLEGGANAPVEKKGAMGTAYNNFGAFGAPLTAKTDPYQASYKAAEAAFTKAKATCAAANTAPCAQAATDYNAAVTEGLKAPQGNGSMPAQNQENQTAANKDLATAVGHVQSMVSSVQSQPAASQQPASQQPAPAAP
ncbi:hypothetical protein EPO15_05110 [bacterium]|nr:MAG: hypothetical protein EPO15_05110 [bacterium]